jgi:CheY-like chemotaxis protein
MAKRILVVEDEEAFAEIVTELLTDEGYSVIRVPDGVTALNMLAAGRSMPDAILCDVRLPGLRGDRLAAEVRRRLPQHQVPILLLSASPNPQLHLPDVYFMSKPFEMSEFLKTVRRLVESRGRPSVARF